MEKRRGRRRVANSDHKRSVQEKAGDKGRREKKSVCVCITTRMDGSDFSKTESRMGYISKSIRGWSTQQTNPKKAQARAVIISAAVVFKRVTSRVK